MPLTDSAAGEVSATASTCPVSDPHIDSAVACYLRNTPAECIDVGFLAYIANLQTVAATAPATATAIVGELADQRRNLKLIASENYCSLATQAAMANLFTDKYAEGYPGHRFYAGCDNVDAVETAACDEARRLFGAEHAYVQPHSGADANLIAYWAVLTTRVQAPMLREIGQSNPAKLDRKDWQCIRTAAGNQRLLGLDYYSGGHLTHGYRFNVSAQMFDAYAYTVSHTDGRLDYDEIEAAARRLRPLILLAGYSAYPRKIDFRRMRRIADDVGAVLMVDMAHFAGLVAGGVFDGDSNPIPFADVVTTTTHKTLRGPRGGIILCRNEFAAAVDAGCPLVIGGPLPHVIAAKAVALREANQSSFRAYAHEVAANARTLADACIERGMELVTGGTDNHLMLIDVRAFGITGRQAESALRECGVTLNRNSLPFDPNGPWYTSGLRIGTPAVTTLGMGAAEMREIADILRLVLGGTKPATVISGERVGQSSRARYVVDDAAAEEARERVAALLAAYPVYPELDVPFLQRHFG